MTFKYDRLKEKVCTICGHVEVSENQQTLFGFNVKTDKKVPNGEIWLVDKGVPGGDETVEILAKVKSNGSILVKKVKHYENQVIDQNNFETK